MNAEKLVADFKDHEFGTAVAAELHLSCLSQGVDAKTGYYTHMDVLRFGGGTQ